MGLTENTATGLLGLGGLDVLPHSALTVAGGESSAVGGRTLLLGPTSAANLDALRDLMPWLRPRPQGTRTSAGFGDRLGLANRAYGFQREPVGRA